MDEARQRVFWDGPRGAYCDGVVWLHVLTSFAKSSAFAELTTRLQITGSASFQTEAELDALTETLALEAQDNVCSHRFIVEWRLGGDKGLDHFLGGRILSESVKFKCSYGVAFNVQLSLSVPASEESSIGISLSIEMDDNYLSPIDIIASGVLFGAGCLPEVRAGGGSNLNPNESGTLNVDRKTLQQLLERGWQTALLRVEVPRWCRPVALASDASPGM